ncbi:MAG: HNH endonuclease [bacterium]|jgi:putative restriction endonuclease|nr:HNH endonuclease [Betaproteobacteria bacterium]
MGVSLVVAVTDGDWFEFLRQSPQLAEVNFWAPSSANFRALAPGELFLFKLHSPRNFIVGGGIYTYSNTLPWSLAWEAFGEANGAPSAEEMRRRIAKYRRADPEDRSAFTIGCRILSQPFFLDESHWIPVPASWSPNIVSFKTYTTDTMEGRDLWNEIMARRLDAIRREEAVPAERYGNPVLVRPRLGQGAFRVMVTDSYERRCAMTSERTLPALEAAHIRPYSDGGEHAPSNGLLLRRDLHALFDGGYMTVTPELKVEVSTRIREEFENGKHYYALHGQSILVPKEAAHRPDRASLDWHNEKRFRP